jgi:hypothetical protein
VRTNELDAGKRREIVGREEEFVSRLAFRGRVLIPGAWLAEWSRKHPSGAAPGWGGCHDHVVVILAGMEITGLGWCGTRTGRCSELAHFYEHVLGLRLVHTEADFWVFELPDGRHVEIFGSSYPGKEHFTTGGCRLRRPRPARGRGRAEKGGG